MLLMILSKCSTAPQIKDIWKMQKIGAWVPIATLDSGISAERCLEIQRPVFRPIYTTQLAPYSQYA